jgi:hypothetical protein
MTCVAGVNHSFPILDIDTYCVLRLSVQTVMERNTEEVAGEKGC